MSSPLNRNKRALSSVISSIILSAAVLVVGGMVWNYANGASSVIASQYHEESMELVSQLKERFMVEHVDNTDTQLSVWVYNYGEVDIQIVVYANIDDAVYHTDQENPITVLAKSSVEATIDVEIDPIDNIGINVNSRRQNNVYYAYIAK